MPPKTTPPRDLRRPRSPKTSLARAGETPDTLRAKFRKSLEAGTPTEEALQDLARLLALPPETVRLFALDDGAFRKARRGTKLTAATVRMIRLYRTQGATFQELAQRYEVSLSVIHDILHGLSWRTPEAGYIPPKGTP